MKNAIILHGHGSTEQSFWHPYLKHELEKREYTVWLPTLPGTDLPILQSQLDFALKNGHFDEETVLVSHSSGTPLAVALLEQLQTPLKGIISVAGFITSVDKDATKMLKKSYNWEKIRVNAGKAVIINSDNDPWHCDEEQGKLLFEKLGGMQIIMHGEGHMGSDTFNQPYKEFPLLVKLIELL